MRLFSDLLIAVILLNGLIILVRSLQRHEALVRWQWLVFLLGLAWLGWAVVSEMVAAELLRVRPADAVYHERLGRAIAADIWAGRNIGEHFRLGNAAYHVWLGLLFAISDCSRSGVNMINAFLGFWGSLLLLTTIAHRVPGARVPVWLLLLTLLLPSALFWTATNLKEGPMYWGITQLLAMALLYNRLTVLGAAGVGSLVLFRPHIALIWVVSVGGALILSPRYRWLGLVAIVASFGMLSVLGEFLGREIRSVDDVQEELDKNYSAIVRAGGSTVEYETAPIPVVSGAVMLFLRPFPWESYSVAMLLASVEIYLLTVLGTYLWLRRRDFVQQARKRPELLIALAACLLFAAMYTYMGNLGLMARQRLQAMPALIILLTIPVLMSAVPAATSHLRAAKR